MSKTSSDSQTTVTEGAPVCAIVRTDEYGHVYDANVLNGAYYGQVRPRAAGTFGFYAVFGTEPVAAEAPLILGGKRRAGNRWEGPFTTLDSLFGRFPEARKYMEAQVAAIERQRQEARAVAAEAGAVRRQADNEAAAEGRGLGKPKIRAQSMDE